MKIAFCVSGVPRSGVGNKERVHEDFQRNRKSHKHAFPTADFYYGTWTQYGDILERDFANEKCTTFDEPEIDYHPFYEIHPEVRLSARLKKIIPKYKNIKDERQDRYRHQTKQILAHASLLKRFAIPDKYDIIVRCRYDTFIYPKAEMMRVCHEVMTAGNAVGFGLPKGASFQNRSMVSPKTPNADEFLFDSLIIHASDRFDPDKAWQLHHEKKLLPCEFGWYQLMGPDHICYTGWANPDRTLAKELLTL